MLHVAAGSVTSSELGGEVGVAAEGAAGDDEGVELLKLG